MTLLGAIAAVIVLFGIGVGIASSDVKEFQPTDDDDCISVTFKENHAFSEDKNRSGLYCKVTP